MVKGIDVSHHNGEIDWRRVKAADIRFAMLRASYGWDDISQADRQLQNNVKGCEENGLPYGLYHYAYAGNPEQAKKEAALFLRVTQGVKPHRPVAYDFEEKAQLALLPEQQLAIIEAFLKEMEAAGHYGVLYMSASPLERLYRYAPERVSRFGCWVAHVQAEKPAFSGKYGLWQYSWKGRVDGVAGDVDLDYADRDFLALIGAEPSGDAVQPPPAGPGAFREELERLLGEASKLRQGLEKLVKKGL